MKTTSHKNFMNMALAAALALVSVIVFYLVVTLIPVSGVKKFGMCIYSENSIKESNEIRKAIITTSKLIKLRPVDISLDQRYSGSGSGFILINLIDEGFLNLNKVRIQINSTRGGSGITVYGANDYDLNAEYSEFINKQVTLTEMLKNQFGFKIYPEGSAGECMPMPNPNSPPPQSQM